MAKEENKYGVVERIDYIAVVMIARRTERRVTWADGDSWRWAPIEALLGTFPSKTLANAAASAAREAFAEDRSPRQVKMILKHRVGYAK